VRAFGLAALVGLAAACGKDGKSESECRGEARELQALLRAADTGPSAIYVDRDITLVPRPELAATARDLPYGPVVTINRDGRYRFGGERDLGAYDVAHQVSLEYEKSAKHRRPDDQEPVVYLVIDAAAPWGPVYSVVDYIESFEVPGRIGFVFGVATAPSTPPPRTWMDDKLDQVLAGEPSQRAVELAKAVSDVVKPCPALARVFGQVGGVAAEDKATALIDALEAALVECRCDLDVPALRSAMYRVLHDDLAAGAELVTQARDGKVISAPQSALWRDVAPTIRGLDVPVSIDADP
jgi:hypothetical protein